MKKSSVKKYFFKTITAIGETDTFLQNLPSHIYRLSVFYRMLNEFIAITMQSFKQSDEGMVKNMGE